VVTGEDIALKMKIIDFLDSCESGSVLPSVLQYYTNLSIIKLSQLLVCSRFHRIEAQFVCWLLMMQDRMETRELTIKQLDIAQLLGMRREAVTQAAGKLQTLQLITYKRGHLRILNRANLEATVCSSYDIIKAQEESFLG
jgi:hypothetical protein